jgi:hypothetical protein
MYAKRALYCCIIALLLYTSTGNREGKEVVHIVALTRSAKDWRRASDSTLYSGLIPSVSRTVLEYELKSFKVEIIVGFDHTDVFWQRRKWRNDVRQSTNIPVKFLLIQRREERLPFNELCEASFQSGADYIVRVNDDTVFTSMGWITQGTDALKQLSPPKVGVVGPTCAGGTKRTILTHDMVHRTHLEIFSEYYPPELINWYVDDWISAVYGKTRTATLKDWQVRHDIDAHGTRYQPVRDAKAILPTLIDSGRVRIDDFLKSGKHSSHNITLSRTSEFV